MSSTKTIKFAAFIIHILRGRVVFYAYRSIIRIALSTKPDLCNSPYTYTSVPPMAPAYPHAVGNCPMLDT